MSELRVVVADDEPDIRLMLRLTLPALGVEVVGEAADGNEVVERCVATTPDAVVLDLLMPEANGFEAIPRLREQCPDVGIVAYTAVAGEFVRTEMARLEVPLVLKQSDVGPLVSALREAHDANGSALA